MPLNGIQLMKAKGLVTPLVGDNFRDDIVNVDGASGRQYVLDGIVFSGSVPVSDLPGGYANSVLFNINADMTQGVRFDEIRRKTSGAWAFSVTAGAGTAVLESYAAFASYDALGVRITNTNNPNGSPLVACTAVSDTTVTADPMPVTFTANPYNLGGSGQSLVEVTPQYFPDTGPFNDQILFNGSGQPWRGYFNNPNYDASSDFDFEWRTALSGGGALMSTAKVWYLSSDVNRYVFPSADGGLLPGQAATTIYLRWRVKPSSGGSGTWADVTVNHTDPRPAS